MENKRAFEIKDLTPAERSVISNLIQEALDERIDTYIKKFGADGTVEFIAENTATMPMVREMYMVRYRATINARLEGR